MLSDRIAIMNSGSIEQAGRPDQIFDFPQSRFVADFMGIANIFDGEVVSCDPSGAAVQIGRLRFETGPAADLKAGQKMALAFRPEHVRITPDADASEGFGAGTVIARVYQGVTCSYQIRLDDGDGVSWSSARPSRAEPASGSMWGPRYPRLAQEMRSMC